MQAPAESAILAGRRIAGFALGALLQTPLYAMLAFLLAGLANSLAGTGTANGIRLLQSVGDVTFAAVSLGVFAVLFAIVATIAPRELRRRAAQGESGTLRKRAAAPFGAVFADAALSTAGKIRFLLTNFVGVMQVMAFVFFLIAMGLGRLMP